MKFIIKCKIIINISFFKWYNYIFFNFKNYEKTLLINKIKNKKRFNLFTYLLI
jgi:hypothetical protein